MFCNWDERNLNRFSSINWRASLVPAAAVIPAPTAYIKVVAVKKLVVGSRQAGAGSLHSVTGPFACVIGGGFGVLFTECLGAPSGLL